jgi:ribosomal-protein-serine acetyltransferase
VTPSHAEGLLAATLASREELLPWMPWARSPSMEGTIVMTQRAPRDWLEHRAYHFAMVERAGGMVLGVAGLNPETSSAAELHYWIRTDHAGRGLVTEACRALIGWAADECHLSKLTLWAGRDNVASRRVAEKLGFVHVGPLAWRPEGGLGEFDAERYELELAPSSAPPPPPARPR